MSIISNNSPQEAVRLAWIPWPIFGPCARTVMPYFIDANRPTLRMRCGRFASRTAPSDQRLQRAGAPGSRVGWLVREAEVVQVLCGWRVVARRRDGIRWTARPSRSGRNMPTATIKLFLKHGDPKRLRTAEISNWSGKAVAAPRTDLDELLARDEAGQAAVYILTGHDPDTGRSAAYIGEAEVLRDRLRTHRGNDSWISVTAFVSKDENLTKAHIRFLEGQLIEEARTTGRFRLENEASSGARLPEADRHEMEEFLEKIRQLLPVLGSDILTPVAVPDQAATDRLTTGLKGLRATGRRTPTGFVVFAGSQAVASDRPSALAWSIEQRRALIADGTLAPADGALVFARDVEFSSPSAAAAIIHGGPVSGLTLWKDAEGRTLREIEAA